MSGVSVLAQLADVARRRGPAVALFVSGLFVVIGLYAIAINGWTELYADQWRLYPIYIGLPLPDSVLVLENGHRPIIPGLIRVAELRWLHGNQWLQLVSGAVFALISCAVLVSLAWRDREVDLSARALAVAVACFAIFWLGNSRMLLHGNESVHAYLLTACLAGAIALCGSGLRHGWMPVAGACVLAVVATFSFGPGLAVFMALALVLAVQRRYRAALGVLVALRFTLTLYLLMPGSSCSMKALATPCPAWFDW